VRTNSDSDDEEIGSNPDIDRHGLNADEARLHFLRASVNARDVDFSDTIATKRKAYKHKTLRTRRRRGDDGIEEVGDLASDSEEETFERKLARLRREAEELKEELERRREAPTQPETEGDAGDGVEALSRALDNIHTSTRATGISGRGIAADGLLSQNVAAASQREASDRTKDSSVAAEQNSASVTQSGLLRHAASFDTRLALVEAALGISTSSNPFTADNNTEPAMQPVLPALDSLTSQLGTLASVLGNGAAAPASVVSTSGSTSSNIEAISARIKKLTADADTLANARRRAAAETAKATSTSTAGKSQPTTTADDIVSPTSPNNDKNTTEPIEPNTDITQRAADEQQSAAKIQALYATLPTIQSLHPLLPSVLERLRSLRALHAGAAQASETLDALEKDQAEMSKEIESWREGLAVVEEKVKESEGAMKRNVDHVGPWVKDLEGRLARLE
jgi:nuclear migration protein JNM1